MLRMLKSITTLAEFEPCPGRAFIDLPDFSISPDVKVMKIDDEWQVVSSMMACQK